MKVLIVHNKYRFEGGEEIVVENEIKLLKQNGHEVFTYIVDNKTISGPLGKIKSAFSSIYSFKQRDAFVALASYLKPDIVHLHNLFPQISPSVIYACKKLRLTCVLTLHNYRLICPSINLFHDGKIYKKGLEKRYFQVIKDRVYQNSFLATCAVTLMINIHKMLKSWNLLDAVIVMTEFQKEIVEKHIEAQIYVVPHFTYTISSTSKAHPNDHFLFVGRLSPEKGLGELLNIWPNEIELRIIGEGPIESDLKSRHKDKSNIKFCGRVNRNSVFTELENCRGLVFSSICYESFGLVLIEAMSVGTPIIYNDIGGVREIVTTETLGLPFEIKSSAMLSNTLSKASNEKRENRHIRMNTFNNHYSPEAGIKNLLAIFTTLACGNKR